MIAWKVVSFHGVRSGLECAQQLANNRHVDRVVLSGQSSRIPMVRWMFSRPVNEGGLGTNLAWSGICLGALYCTGTPAIVYDGQIDEVGIWSRTLVQADVDALYNGGAGVGFNTAGMFAPLYFLDSEGQEWSVKMEKK